MDEGDLAVPPQFSCEKCGGEMYPEYYEGEGVYGQVYRIEDVRSKTRARRSFLYASRHTGTWNNGKGAQKGRSQKTTTVPTILSEAFRKAENVQLSLTSLKYPDVWLHTA
jgi:hypothetical protein